MLVKLTRYGGECFAAGDLASQVGGHRRRDQRVRSVHQRAEKQLHQEVHHVRHRAEVDVQDELRRGEQKKKITS